MLKTTKKNSPVLMILFVLLAFSSCKKDPQEYTVNLKSQGFLKIKIIDDSGRPVSGAKIFLFLSEEDDDYEPGTTNSEGIVDFGELLTGKYIITGKDIEIGGRKYSFLKSIQVLTNMNTPISVNPQDYTGNVEITVMSESNYTYINIPDINIALISSSDYSSTLTHSEIISISDFKGKTDNDGKISFENIPSNTSFRVYAYFDEDHSDYAEMYPSYYGSYYFSVDRDDDKGVSVIVDRSEIYDIVGNLNLSFYYYGYDGDGNYGSHYIPNLKIALVKSTDYNNYNLYYANHSTILSYVKYTKDTNEDGLAVFNSVKANTNYKVYVYFDENRKSWANSYYTISVSEGYTENYEFEVEEDNLNLP